MVAVDRAAAELETAVDKASACLRAGGRLVYVGAGTAGRIASLDAVECRPTFGVDSDRVTALLAGGASASDTAFETAEDDPAGGRAEIAALGVGSRDVVIGVTASGRTPFVVEALRAAREAGAVTVAVTNNEDTLVADIADHAVELLTGPEVVGGSTRLAAATAQKVALNTISTAAFVRCGRTYGAWMVGLQPTNAKLQARARRILQEATGRDEPSVERAMKEGEMPDAALVMLLTDVGPAEARRALRATSGHVRMAVRRVLDS
jgi:N-acetylmuramic acid 6-phosphate etherase